MSVDTLWGVLPDFLNSLTTIFVALLVAYFATRRETGKQVIQRHFDFRDERAAVYAEILEKLNDALGLYFDVLEVLPFQVAPNKQKIEKLEIAARQIDTAVMKLQIIAPEYVSHACLNVNGRIQIMTISASNGEKGLITGEDFDVSKRNLIKVMKVDLRLIENTRDRQAYTKATARENTRYFREIGVDEPSK